jgi:hypothetical protein
VRIQGSCVDYFIMVKQQGFKVTVQRVTNYDGISCQGLGLGFALALRLRLALGLQVRIRVKVGVRVWR